MDNSFCKLLWSGTVVNPLCPLAIPFVVVVCLGLAPSLSGLLFSFDETQIWLGDLRVVVVVGPVLSFG